MKSKAKGLHGDGSIVEIARKKGPGFQAYLAGRYLGIHDSEEAAKEIIAEAQEAKSAKAYRGIARTLSELKEEWLEAHKTEVSVRTLRGYASSCKHIDRCEIGAMPVTEIRLKDLKDLERELKGSKGGPRLDHSTRGHVMKRVKQALAYAKERELIESHPGSDLKVGRRQKTDRQAGSFYVYSPGEIRQILKHPSVEKRTAFAVAIYLGARQGEVAALRWENIHLKDKHPHVYIDGSWNGEHTKTSEPRRAALLAQLTPHLREWHMASGRPIGGLVFPSAGPGNYTNGRPELPGRERPYGRSYDWGWGRSHKGGWREDSGVGVGRFHDFRHSCATHLLRGTWTDLAWSIEAVSVQMGHSDIQTTQRYAHKTHTMADEFNKEKRNHSARKSHR